MSRVMKHSGVEWIGEIPEQWKITKLNKVTDCFDGKRVPIDKSLRNEGPYPYWGAGSITGYVDDFLFDEEIILLGEDGAPFFDRRRNVAHLVQEKVWVNNHIHVLKGKEGVSNDFLVHYLNVVDFGSYINGSILNKLTQGNMNKIAVVIPSLVEQQKIATFLDNKTSQIDSIINNTKQSIAEFKKYKQALITETVTKGLNLEVKMKDTETEWIGQIPEHWVCSKIKYITSLSRGQFSHRPRNDERFYDGEYPFIQTGDVAKSNKFITSYSQTLNELGKSVSKEFPKGTLVMTIAANVGDVAVLGFDSYFPDSVIGFIPKNGYYWNYLYYLFAAMKPSFVSTAIVSTQLNLNIERVKEMHIPITMDSNEQQQIADYLDEKCTHVDSLIADKEKMISEFEDYKKALIYEYVTGKKEVE